MTDRELIELAAKFEIVADLRCLGSVVIARGNGAMPDPFDDFYLRRLFSDRAAAEIGKGMGEA